MRFLSGLPSYFITIEYIKIRVPNVINGKNNDHTAGETIKLIHFCVYMYICILLVQLLHNFKITITYSVFVHCDEKSTTLSTHCEMFSIWWVVVETWVTPDVAGVGVGLRFSVWVRGFWVVLSGCVGVSCRKIKELNVRFETDDVISSRSMNILTVFIGPWTLTCYKYPLSLLLSITDNCPTWVTNMVQLAVYVI